MDSITEAQELEKFSPTSDRRPFEVVLRGGSPWGFSLDGGEGETAALHITKIAEGSKAENSALLEGDIVLSVNGIPCGGRQAAQQLVDSAFRTITLKVLRSGWDNSRDQQNVNSSSTSTSSSRASRALSFQHRGSDSQASSSPRDRAGSLQWPPLAHDDSALYVHPKGANPAMRSSRPRRGDSFTVSKSKQSPTTAADSPWTRPPSSGSGSGFNRSSPGPQHSNTNTNANTSARSSYPDIRTSDPQQQHQQGSSRVQDRRYSDAPSRYRDRERGGGPDYPRDRDRPSMVSAWGSPDPENRNNPTGDRDGEGKVPQTVVKGGSDIGGDGGSDGYGKRVGGDISMKRERSSGGGAQDSSDLDRDRSSYSGKRPYDQRVLLTGSGSAFSEQGPGGDGHVNVTSSSATTGVGDEGRRDRSGYGKRAFNDQRMLTGQTFSYVTGGSGGVTGGVGGNGGRSSGDVTSCLRVTEDMYTSDMSAEVSPALPAHHGLHRYQPDYENVITAQNLQSERISEITDLEDGIMDSLPSSPQQAARNNPYSPAQLSPEQQVGRSPYNNPTEHQGSSRNTQQHFYNPTEHYNSPAPQSPEPQGARNPYKNAPQQQPTLPERDLATLKHVPVNQNHEKYPSWPVSQSVSAASEQVPAAINTRAQSLTDHTTTSREFPAKQRLAYHPGGVAGASSSSSYQPGLRPLQEKNSPTAAEGHSHETPPGGKNPRNSSDPGLKNAQPEFVYDRYGRVVQKREMKGRFEDFYHNSKPGYLPPRFDSDGHSYGDKEYNAPSPPERDMGGVDRLILSEALGGEPGDRQPQPQQPQHRASPAQAPQHQEPSSSSSSSSSPHQRGNEPSHRTISRTGAGAGEGMQHSAPSSSSSTSSSARKQPSALPLTSLHPSTDPSSSRRGVVVVDTATSPLSPGSNNRPGLQSVASPAFTVVSPPHHRDFLYRDSPPGGGLGRSAAAGRPVMVKQTPYYNTATQTDVPSSYAVKLSDPRGESSRQCNAEVQVGSSSGGGGGGSGVINQAPPPPPSSSSSSTMGSAGSQNQSSPGPPLRGEAEEKAVQGTVSSSRDFQTSASDPNKHPPSPLATTTSPRKVSAYPNPYPYKDSSKRTNYFQYPFQGMHSIAAKYSTDEVDPGQQHASSSSSSSTQASEVFSPYLPSGDQASIMRKLSEEFYGGNKMGMLGGDKRHHSSASSQDQHSPKPPAPDCGLSVHSGTMSQAESYSSVIIHPSESAGPFGRDDFGSQSSITDSRNDLASLASGSQSSSLKETGPRGRNSLEYFPRSTPRPLQESRKFNSLTSISHHHHQRDRSAPLPSRASESRLPKEDRSAAPLTLPGRAQGESRHLPGKDMYVDTRSQRSGSQRGSSSGSEPSPSEPKGSSPSSQAKGAPSVISSSSQAYSRAQVHVESGSSSRTAYTTASHHSKTESADSVFSNVSGRIDTREGGGSSTQTSSSAPQVAKRPAVSEQQLSRKHSMKKAYGIYDDTPSPMASPKKASSSSSMDVGTRGRGSYSNDSSKQLDQIMEEGDSSAQGRKDSGSSGPRSELVRHRTQADVSDTRHRTHGDVIDTRHRAQSDVTDARQRSQGDVTDGRLRTHTDVADVRHRVNSWKDDLNKRTGRSGGGGQQQKNSTEHGSTSSSGRSFESSRPQHMVEASIDSGVGSEPSEHAHSSNFLSVDNNKTSGADLKRHQPQLETGYPSSSYHPQKKTGKQSVGSLSVEHSPESSLYESIGTPHSPTSETVSHLILKTNETLAKRADSIRRASSSSSRASSADYVDMNRARRETDWSRLRNSGSFHYDSNRSSFCSENTYEDISVFAPSTPRSSTQEVPRDGEANSRDTQNKFEEGLYRGKMDPGVMASPTYQNFPGLQASSSSSRRRAPPPPPRSPSPETRSPPALPPRNYLPREDGGGEEEGRVGGGPGEEEERGGAGVEEGVKMDFRSLVHQWESNSPREDAYAAQLRKQAMRFSGQRGSSSSTSTAAPSSMSLIHSRHQMEVTSSFKQQPTVAHMATSPPGPGPQGSPSSSSGGPSSASPQQSSSAVQQSPPSTSSDISSPGTVNNSQISSSVSLSSPSAHQTVASSSSGVVSSAYPAPQQPERIHREDHQGESSYSASTTTTTTRESPGPGKDSYPSSPSFSSRDRSVSDVPRRASEHFASPSRERSCSDTHHTMGKGSPGPGPGSAVASGSQPPPPPPQASPPSQDSQDGVVVDPEDLPPPPPELLNDSIAGSEKSELLERQFADNSYGAHKNSGSRQVGNYQRSSSAAEVVVRPAATTGTQSQSQSQCGGGGGGRSSSSTADPASDPSATDRRLLGTQGWTSDSQLQLQQSKRRSDSQSGGETMGGVHSAAGGGSGGGGGRSSSTSSDQGGSGGGGSVASSVLRADSSPVRGVKTAHPQHPLVHKPFSSSSSSHHSHHSPAGAEGKTFSVRPFQRINTSSDSSSGGTGRGERQGSPDESQPRSVKERIINLERKSSFTSSSPSTPTTTTSLSSSLLSSSHYTASSPSGGSQWSSSSVQSPSNGHWSSSSSQQQQQQQRLSAGGDSRVPKLSPSTSSSSSSPPSSSSTVLTDSFQAPDKDCFRARPYQAQQDPSTTQSHATSSQSRRPRSYSEQPKQADSSSASPHNQADTRYNNSRLEESSPKAGGDFKAVSSGGQQQPFRFEDSSPKDSRAVPAAQQQQQQQASRYEESRFSKMSPPTHHRGSGSRPTSSHPPSSYYNSERERPRSSSSPYYNRRESAPITQIPPDAIVAMVSPRRKSEGSCLPPARSQEDVQQHRESLEPVTTAHGRQPSQEELECDMRARELAREVEASEKKLSTVLRSDASRGRMQYMDGLFSGPGEVKTPVSVRRNLSHGAGDASRRRAQGGPQGQSSSSSSSSQPEDMAHKRNSLPREYFVSAPKAVLEMEWRKKEEVTSDLTSNIHDSQGLVKQKEELVEKLLRKLDLLKEERTALQEEITEIDQLGHRVCHAVDTKCQSSSERDKFHTYISDLEKIVRLLLNLSGQLARAENAVQSMNEDTDPEVKKRTLTKRERLQTKHKEAQQLKADIDRRSDTVTAFLRQSLAEEELNDYAYFVKMKSKLTIDFQELEDKISLGQEQVQELRNSIPEEQSSSFSSSSTSLLHPEDTSCHSPAPSSSPVPSSS